MIKIYQAEWCPYCKKVRDWISDNLNDIPLIFISVQHDREKRVNLKKASGQVFVPTLIDEETKTIIPDDDEKIIEYLKSKFPVEDEKKVIEKDFCPI